MDKRGRGGGAARRGGRPGGASRGGSRGGRVSKGAGEKRKFNRNEEIQSDDDDNGVGLSENNTALDNDSEEQSQKRQRPGESAEEARLRLAKGYLEKLEDAMSKEGMDGGIDAEQMDKDNMAARIRDDVADMRGKYKHIVAAKLVKLELRDEDIITFKGHSRAVTAVVISEDESTLYTASKDCNIIRWDVESKKKVFTFSGKKVNSEKKFSKGHNGEILTLALSSDAKLLASGGTDKGHQIRLWDLGENKHLENLVGHRDVISCLAFKKGSAQLYSGSYDRTLKIWNAKSGLYMDTLFGHGDKVIAVDSLYKENPVSTGEGKAVHLWRIERETQLAFHGHSSAVECVSMFDESTFVTGGQDGDLSVWVTSKKRPAGTVHKAHGAEAPWISAVAALPFSDLFVSGSCDGFLRFWKVTLGGESGASITCVMQLPMEGWINSLSISPNGRTLAVGIGRDHRLGRWHPIEGAKNCTKIVRLPIKI